MGAKEILYLEHMPCNCSNYLRRIKTSGSRAFGLCFFLHKSTCKLSLLSCFSLKANAVYVEQLVKKAAFSSVQCSSVREGRTANSGFCGCLWTR